MGKCGSNGLDLPFPWVSTPPASQSRGHRLLSRAPNLPHCNLSPPVVLHPPPHLEFRDITPLAWPYKATLPWPALSLEPLAPVSPQERPEQVAWPPPECELKRKGPEVQGLPALLAKN